MSRKQTTTHYRIHAKKGIDCKMCATQFANVNHLKEHWLLVHEDAPWEEPTDQVEQFKPT